MKRMLTAVLLFSVAASHNVQGQSVEAFRFAKPLEAPEVPRQRLAAFDLDEEVFASTQNGYADLRVLDGDGTETPYIVRTLRQKKRVEGEKPADMRTVSLEELPDNRFELRFERKQKDAELVALVFATPLKNFEKKITVHGSGNGKTWSRLVDDQPIFDYSRFIDLRNTRVDLPRSRHRHFKVVVENIAESKQSPLTKIVRETRNDALFSRVEETDFKRTDFRIDRVDFMERIVSEAHSAPVTRSYAVSDLHVDLDDEPKQTVVTFTSCRAPVSAIKLRTPDVNFSRPLTVEGSDAKEGDTGWNVLARGTFSRIDVGSIRREATRIDLGRIRRMRRYRLTIENRDSPPVAIESVETIGEVIEAVFFHNRDLSYELLYGSDTVKAPVYDIAKVIGTADDLAADAYRPGKQRENPAYRSSSGRLRFDSRGFLIAAVVLMVLVLIVVIAKAAKGIDAVE